MPSMLVTCPETAHLERIEYEDHPLGMLILACSRFEPGCALQCQRTCAARLDRKRRSGAMTPNTSALVFGGDWACAHGDPAGLAEVARQLSERVGDPLRLELIELSQLCRCDVGLASRRWPLLREQVVCLQRVTRLLPSA